VIIPVYNAERFLRPCVESVLAQTYRDLTLFLVDDESTDESGNLCDEYARRDPRVQVIHQKNAGPANARNAAIERMGPEGCVLFLDADDYLAPQAIERCVQAFETHRADMVIFNFAHVIQDTGDISENRMEFTGGFGWSDIIRFIDGTNNMSNSGLIGPAWRRALSCRLIQEHHLRFPDGVYLAEDIVFMAAYFTKCQTFHALDEVLFFKRAHDKNLSIGFRGIPVEAMIRGYEGYKTILDRAPAEDNRKLDRQFVDDMIGSIVKLHHPRPLFTPQDQARKTRQIVDYLASKQLLKGHPLQKGHSRLLALSIRFRCLPLIHLVARARAKKRYAKE